MSCETTANINNVFFLFLCSECSVLPGIQVLNYHLIDLKVTFIVQDFWLEKILQYDMRIASFENVGYGMDKKAKALSLVLKNGVINDKGQQ